MDIWGGAGGRFAFYTSICSSYGNFNLFTYKQLACYLSCTHFPLAKLLGFADFSSSVWIQALYKHPSLDVIFHSLKPAPAHSFC